MQYIPHDYQAYCIQRVVEDPTVGLFLRPGLGKTVITLSAVNILKYFRWQVAKVLVVAPKKVAEATWSKEAAKWDHLQHLRVSTVLGSASKRIKALNTPADVYVINRENFEWLVDYYQQAWPFDMVVFDESTSFKNPQSKRFKAAKRIRRFIKKVVLLTGTPSSKGLIDLWAQVYLLDGGARLGPTLSAYRERYFDPDQRSRTQIFSYKAKDGAESAVLTVISDICISMKAEDYLQLPDFIQHEIPVMLDPKAKKAYDQFERDLLLEVDEDIITAGTAGVLVGKLLQFCNGAVYGNDGKVVPVHDCKLEAYTELLEQLNGEHCLTFYGYQHDKDRILERLEKYNRGRADKLRVRVYKGVEDEEAWNAGEVDVLLVHPASCAYGLNLQAGGRHVVWYDDRVWDSGNVNAYASSDLDSWFNSTYKNMLDADIRSLIGTTKIRYTPGNGNNTVGTLERAIFALSLTELGQSHSYANTEGSALPIASTLRIAYRNGSATTQWTRSPYTNSTSYAWWLISNGNIDLNNCGNSYGSRPAFTLPSSLYVSDDGSVFQNTAPSTPASISVPSSIDGGSTITVSWGTSTDAEGNLEGYIVERQTDGGSWSQIYQGTATSTTNTVAFGTNTVAYRVKAYDAAGLESGWKTSSTVTVTNNRAPGAPGSLTVPAVVRGGSNLAISWTAASDSDGNLSGYELERQVDGGSWTQIYKGSALAYTDTITAGWNTVAYRVRSYDSYNATSTYVTSETRTVDNNAIPVITSSTTSGTDLGTKEDGFDLTYTVTDADNDTVTVKEYLDDVLKRTYTATLGQSNTVQCVTAANWQKVLNGAHTIKVVANDTKADSTPYTVTFTKAVYEASITLAEPMDADDTITVMVLNVLGSIPADADLEVLVTNNANDTEPVWEDATQDVKNGNNHVFTNQTAANGFAFNFKVNVGRGTSNTGGYITSIGGAFQ